MLVYSPFPECKDIPAVRECAAVWNAPAKSSRMIGPMKFCYLNMVREVVAREDWNRSDWPKLWLYNLHYFDDLNSRNALARDEWLQSLISRWIVENPVGMGPGWDPYPTSLRIVNWTKWLLWRNAPTASMLESLYLQARWLEDRLEIHLLANHLLANAKALIFSGAFFGGDEASRWTRKGLRILRRQLEEQILEDGGHIERSPMYHGIVLEDLLDLLYLAQIFPGLVSDRDILLWKRSVKRQLRWLQMVIHPDGEISFFNDAAFGVSQTFRQLSDQAVALGVDVATDEPADVQVLSESGYVRARVGLATLLADVGSVGPDYNPGHAHAETLSFELSIERQRVIVNAGISTYEAGSDRQAERGTASHSTVQILDLNSSEVWGAFRVGRRARVSDFSFRRLDDEGVEFGARHDGFMQQGLAAYHRRQWLLKSGSLEIIDAIEGGYSGAAISRLHFHPNTTAQLRGSEVELSINDAYGGISWEGDEVVAVLTRGVYHPEFGRSIPNLCLEVRFRNRLMTRIRWGRD